MKGQHAESSVEIRYFFEIGVGFYIFETFFHEEFILQTLRPFFKSLVRKKVELNLITLHFMIFPLKSVLRSQHTLIQQLPRVFQIFQINFRKVSDLLITITRIKSNLSKHIFFTFDSFLHDLSQMHICGKPLHQKLLLINLVLGGVCDCEHQHFSHKF
jgi:hypothetical protein